MSMRKIRWAAVPRRFFSDAFRLGSHTSTFGHPTVSDMKVHALCIQGSWVHFLQEVDAEKFWALPMSFGSAGGKEVQDVLAQLGDPRV